MTSGVHNPIYDDPALVIKFTRKYSDADMTPSSVDAEKQEATLDHKWSRKSLIIWWAAIVFTLSIVMGACAVAIFLLLPAAIPAAPDLDPTQNGDVQLLDIDAPGI
ncbi:uncharacterized protein LOC129601168 [Paramacrobiotus metropolitanus]|uniref:uncharacterized protein LOC129601168 n=1 Tax=Paramacrobiotus metropolitanus TaxID=2943436 RepID=UPI002445DD55|nr:uncharacterized protein LOC129601168 [Paramacrobiotus metropolitanus]